MRADYADCEIARLAADYRPSSCHGIVGSDGTRRCMTRGRSTGIGFGFGSLIGLGSRRFSKVRCGFTSRASAGIKSRIGAVTALSRQQCDRDDDQRHEFGTSIGDIVHIAHRPSLQPPPAHLLVSLRGETPCDGVV